MVHGRGFTRTLSAEKNLPLCGQRIRKASLYVKKILVQCCPSYGDNIPPLCICEDRVIDVSKQITFSLKRDEHYLLIGEKTTKWALLFFTQAVS
jgi:hypothetical protein